MSANTKDFISCGKNRDRTLLYRQLCKIRSEKENALHYLQNHCMQDIRAYYTQKVMQAI